MRNKTLFFALMVWALSASVVVAMNDGEIESLQSFLERYRVAKLHGDLLACGFNTPEDLQNVELLVDRLDDRGVKHDDISFLLRQIRDRFAPSESDIMLFDEDLQEFLIKSGACRQAENLWRYGVRSMRNIGRLQADALTFCGISNEPQTARFWAEWRKSKKLVR